MTVLWSWYFFNDIAATQPQTNYKVHSLPPPWSSEISDTDNRGIALYNGKVGRSPWEYNASFVERRDDKDWVDVEFLRGNSVLDLEGLYEETDETSSLELSYPSGRSVLSSALVCNKNIICQQGNIWISLLNMTSAIVTVYNHMLENSLVPTKILISSFSRKIFIIDKIINYGFA